MIKTHPWLFFLLRQIFHLFLITGIVSMELRGNLSIGNAGVVFFFFILKPVFTEIQVWTPAPSESKVCITIPFVLFYSYQKKFNSLKDSRLIYR